MKAEDRTPEQQKRHDEKVANKKLQRANLQKLIALITSAFLDEEEVTEEMNELAISLKKKPRTTGLTGVKAVVKNMFGEVGGFKSEDEIWAEHKLGRAEMRKVTVNLIKKEDPENRQWISFDPEEGIYTLEGMGENAPKGWTGYTPVKVEDIEIM